MFHLLLSSGCNDSHGSDIDDELESFVRDADDAAKRACGASKAEIEAYDADTPAATCYFELATEFHRCEREALRAHASEARALLRCLERDRDALLACCTEGGRCSYEKIEVCYQTLWDGDSQGECAADTSEIEADEDECFEADGWTTDDDEDPCADVTQQAVGWSEQTSLGRSPAQVFETISGSCDTNYTLDFQYLDVIQATPTQSAGSLHMSVTFDTSSARWVTPRKSMERLCPAHLEATATVRLESADGLLQETVETSARADQQGRVYSISADLLPGTLQGSLQLEHKEQGKLRFGFELYEMVPGCRGDFSASFESAPDRDGIGFGIGAGVGHWGATI